MEGIQLHTVRNINVIKKKRDRAKKEVVVSKHGVLKLLSSARINHSGCA